MMKGSSALLSRFFKQQASARSLDISASRVTPSYRVLSTSALPDADHHHETEKMLSEGGGSTTSFHEKKNEIKGVTEDTAEDASGMAKDKLNEVKDQVSENVSAGKDTAQDKVHQAKESVSAGKEAASDVAGEKAGQAKSAMGKIGEQAKKEMDTSADMMKGTPQKVSETAHELKEVGVEAGKAVKRDAGRIVDGASEVVGKEVNTSSDMMKDVPQKVSETTQELKEVGVEAAKAVKRDATQIAEKVGLKNPS